MTKDISAVVEVSSEVERKTLFEIGWKPAGYRQAYHPAHGMANLSEEDYAELKAADLAHVSIKPMKRFDYSWRCDCNAEGSTQTLNESRREARAHLKTHYDKTPNWTVIVDQYDLREGELSGKYWKIEKNH